MPLPWYLGIAMIAVPFMIIGRHSYVAINKCNAITKRKGLLMLVSASFFILLGAFTGVDINMMEGNVPSPWLLYLIPFFGVAATYCLSALLGKSAIARGLLIWLGRNSLIIMCLHEPIKRIVIKVCSVLTHCDTNALRESELASLLMAVVTVTICIPFVILISKRLPWMVGKSKTHADFANARRKNLR